MAPWRLARITIIQFIEDLPNRQAADAVQGRIDVKYLLGLEQTDPGFDATVLCGFRTRLVEGEAEQLLLDAMLALFKERGWLEPRERQRTDSTYVLVKVQAINRLMCVGEVMRFALNSLAVVAGSMSWEGPALEWVATHIKHHAQADREGDPHSPSKGSFMGIFAGSSMNVRTTDPNMYCRNLVKDPIVTFILEGYRTEDRDACEERG